MANDVKYDHELEFWAEVLRKHGYKVSRPKFNNARNCVICFKPFIAVNPRYVTCGNNRCRKIRNKEQTAKTRWQKKMAEDSDSRQVTA